MFTSQLFGNIKRQCASSITIFISEETRNHIHTNVLLIIKLFPSQQMTQMFFTHFVQLHISTTEVACSLHGLAFRLKHLL